MKTKLKSEADQAEAKKPDPFYMAGTEGTGKYIVLAISSRGRVGYRDLGGYVRVRVEPSAKASKYFGASFDPSVWKQPGAGQNRYSCIIVGSADKDNESLLSALRAGMRAIGALLGKRRLASAVRNKNAPKWAKSLK